MVAVMGWPLWRSPLTVWPFRDGMPPVSRHVTADAACARLASAQHGVLTREQAFACGLSKGSLRRRLSSGQWLRCRPGVYRFPGAPPSWLQTLMVSCLHTQGAASHRAAAALHGLEGFASDIVEVSATKQVRAVSPGVILHVVESLPASDVGSKHRVPTTTPARTLVDLAAVVPVDRLESALEDALRQRLVTVPLVSAALDPLGTRGRRGAGRLAGLLRDRGATHKPTQSELEMRFMRLLERAGLPPAERQYVIEDFGPVSSTCRFRLSTGACRYRVRRLQMALRSNGMAAGYETPERVARPGLAGAAILLGGRCVSGAMGRSTHLAVPIG
jgi:hypothetical protein